MRNSRTIDLGVLEVRRPASPATEVAFWRDLIAFAAMAAFITGAAMTAAALTNL